jgi:hypothetical protein
MLSATTDCDEGSLLALSGDFDSAFHLFTRAAETAKESGWSRGVVVAAINLADTSVAQNRTQEAERQLHVAAQQPFRNVITRWP